MQSFTILLDAESARMIKRKCMMLPVTPEEYIANLVMAEIRRDYIMLKDGTLLRMDETDMKVLSKLSDMEAIVLNMIESDR